MVITEIVLPTRDLVATGAFYAALGFEVTQLETAVVVTIGRSTVLFDPAAYEGSHHLAFTVATGTFDAGVAWLRENATIISRDGQEVFEAEPAWNARSVYFEGPDDSVLELIERRDLPEGAMYGGPTAVLYPDAVLRRAAGAPFGAADVVCVSEVGVAVDDVPATVEKLAENGIRTYGEPSDTFAPCGDLDGMLIVVPPGRRWFPTADKVVQQVHTTVQAEHAPTVMLSKIQGLYPSGN